MNDKASILAGEEAAAVVVDGDASSPFLLVCEHAGKVIPRALGNLGLSPADLERHIAWDIGAEAVARRLAGLLHAPLVLQRYSRLVYDCNRPPESPGAIPAVSETTDIPGNRDLGRAERLDRINSIYLPFRQKLAEMIDTRMRAGTPPVLVTVHSFTPVYKGVKRNVDLGILHDADCRLADALLALQARMEGLTVRRNEPYGPGDGVTHTLIEHALPRGLLNVMLEIRNDLVTDAAGQAAMARRLSRYLREALAVAAPATTVPARAGGAH